MTKYAVISAVGLSLLLGGTAHAEKAPDPARPTVVGYVSDYGAGNVVPILSGNVPGKAIYVGKHPSEVVFAPGGKMAYVVTDNAVTPIRVATGTRARSVHIASGPSRYGGLAITPNGQTIYVAGYEKGIVTPIATGSGRAGRPIHVGVHPFSIVIPPSGRTAYVSNFASGTVTPINTRTNIPGRPIRVGPHPSVILAGPSGRSVFVLTERPAVVPIQTAHNTVGRPIRTGSEPFNMAITPNGRWLYVLNGYGKAVTPILLTSRRAYPDIAAGDSPVDIVASPNSRAFYVLNFSGAVVPVSTASRSSMRAVEAGSGTSYVAISNDGRTLYVSKDGYRSPGRRVIPINLLKGKVDRAISVGRTPADISIVPSLRPARG